MSARNFVRECNFLQREAVKLWVTGTGAGAADLTAIDSAGQGVVSIVHTGTGLYTVNLKDPHVKMLGLDANVIDATTPAVWSVTPVTADVTAASKAITIVVFKAGVAADLTTDEKLQLEISLSNTQRGV
jgi:hypothetical protein